MQKKYACHSFSDNKVVGRHDLSSLQKLAWIQLDLKLPEEDDADDIDILEAPEGDVRRLGDSQPVAAAGRQLQQSTTQVCYFYSYIFHSALKYRFPPNETFRIHSRLGLVHVSIWVSL